MEQQLAVSEAEKCLFMASKWDDQGQLIEEKHFWYEPDLKLRQKIIAGWEQFAIDLANYQPEAEATAAPTADPVLQLPALMINVSGEIAIKSNLDEFSRQLNHFIAITNTDPETDQDFANIEMAIKVHKDAEAALDSAESHAIAQTASVDEMCRTVTFLREISRKQRLMLEKLVKSKKDAIRTAMVHDAKTAFTNFCGELAAELTPIRLDVPEPQFGAAIKNKRTISSLKDAIDTEMANAKIAAEAIAKDIRLKLKWLRPNAIDHQFLFNDLRSIIYNNNFDSFKIVVESRIAGYEIEKAKQQEAERARIQAEEEAKAQAKAEQIIKKAEADRLAAEQRKKDQEMLQEEERQAEIAAIARGEAMKKAEADRLAAQEAQRQKVRDLTRENEEVIASAQAKLAQYETFEAIHGMDKVVATDNPTITIPASKYQAMVNRLLLLDALQESGIERWEGYASALVIYQNKM
jgi:hypothetical protein